jgi:hypothetical protein
MTDDWGLEQGKDIKVEDVKCAVASFIAKKEEKKTAALYTDAEVENMMTTGAKKSSKICCLVYGADGTGKTGIIFDYLTDEDVKAGYKMIAIDLDGGGMPLKDTYHKSKGENLIVIDPLVTVETDDGTEIDYQKTFAKIRAVIRYVRNNHDSKKIKAIVFDGLSTALSYAEQQMRLDKHIDVDGGVQTRYWLMRNKLFLDTLEQIKSIPIAKFFIAHENFIIGGKTEVSSVIMKTNAMMVQKVKCIRKDLPTSIVFTSVIDKSKYNVDLEGASYDFCEVNKAEKKHKWSTKEIYKVIEGVN